jgi:hypothetical protein
MKAHTYISYMYEKCKVVGLRGGVTIDGEYCNMYLFVCKRNSPNHFLLALDSVCVIDVPKHSQLINN